MNGRLLIYYFKKHVYAAMHALCPLYNLTLIICLLSPILYSLPLPGYASLSSHSHYIGDVFYTQLGSRSRSYFIQQLNVLLK